MVNNSKSEKIIEGQPDEGIDGDVCKVICFDEDLVREIKDNMVGEEKIRELSEFYKLLGNPTRLKIIFALSMGELCVCDVSEVLGLSIPATSQQLKQLRQRGLLRHRNDGRMSYFSLQNPQLFEFIKGDVEFMEKGEKKR